MRDKGIRDRRKSGESVNASIEIHLEDVVTPLEAALAEHLAEDEVMPDLRTLFRILQRMLAAALLDLTTAADAHLRELDNDIGLRRRRDELVPQLGARVARFRKTVDGLFGTGSARTLAGLVGRTEQEPWALLRQVEGVLERFADPELELEPPGFLSTRMDPADVIEDFQDEYDELKELLAELNTENRKSDATIIAKNDATTRYDKHFRWIAGCLSSFYHLAGLHELAERIKPSTRRPGQTQSVVDEDRAESSDEPSETEASGENAQDPAPLSSTSPS